MVEPLRLKRMEKGVLFLGLVKPAKQTDRIARFVVGNFVHIVPNKHQTPPAGPFQIFNVRWVRDIGRVKSRSLVGDLGLELNRVDLNKNRDRLGMVHLIAVLDGIHQRLFHSKFYTKTVPGPHLDQAQQRLEAILDNTDLCRITFNDYLIGVDLIIFCRYRHQS